VIIQDENKKLYSLICQKTDKFSSLELELFKKGPSLKNQNHYYISNDKKIDISKTLEQNNINDNSIIYYKIEKNNDENNEEISVIISSSSQDFKSSFICKKSDKFKVLQQKLYEKNQKLKNKSLYYLYDGNNIDVEKTIEENNIKEGGIIIYNINLFDDNNVYDEVL